jgi:hypothetical protein
MSVAFLVPIHPPKYQGFGSMLKILSKNKVPVYLVFSNDSDFISFSSFADTLGVNAETYNNIIIPHSEYNFPVVYKRMFGLHYLMDNKNYDFIIAPDGDVAPIAENLTNEILHAKCQKYFSDKVIWGGPCKGRFFNQIWDTTVSLFTEEDRKKLLSLPRTYTWFSDAPIYESNTLKEFLYNFPLTRVASFDFYRCFDHMMYSFFLVLYHDFRFESAMDNGLELCDDENGIKQCIARGYNLNWVRWNLKHVFYNHELRPFMLYHTDR